MNELNTGELADHMALTFAEFWERNKRVGAFQGNDALDNYVSEKCDEETRIAEQMKHAGQTGKVGTEA